MKVVGITGGVGAGKSTILKLLENHSKCFIIMADDLAKKLCIRGERCFEPLVNLLGQDVIGEDGEIDKVKMSSMIFNDNNIRSSVNGIIHPSVKEYIIETINIYRENNTIDYLFIEAALLIEDGYKEIVDEMWYIYTSEDIRRERLKKSRGYSDEKIDSILKSQLSDYEFRNNCDFVIDNSFSEENSLKQIIERITD